MDGRRLKRSIKRPDRPRSQADDDIEPPPRPSNLKTGFDLLCSGIHVGSALILIRQVMLDRPAAFSQ